MATRRDALIRRRAARGFTQESLAEHLRVERSTVGRWERGVGTLQSWIQPRLARALEVSLDKLAILLDPDPAPPTQPAQDWHHLELAGVLEAPWSMAGTMRVLHDMAGGPMDRRGF